VVVVAVLAVFIFVFIKGLLGAARVEASAEDAATAVKDLLGSEVLTKAIARQNIVGLWGSLDREGYQVEFTAGGEMTETLDPNTVVAIWDLVNFNEGPNEVVSTVAFSQDGVFLKQSLDEGKNHFYYKIVQVDRERFIMIYLHQSGILSFDRIR